MAENKKSVLLYCDIIHTVESLTDQQAGKLFKHYLRYINDKNPAAPDKLTQIVFEPIKQNLKRDLKKWEEILVKRSKAGLASAGKRQHMLTHVESVEQTQHLPTVTATVNDTVKDTSAISRDKVYEYLRGAAPIGTSKQEVEAEADKLMKEYAGKKIGNLKALCDKWMGNYSLGEIMPVVQKNMNHFI